MAALRWSRVGAGTETGRDGVVAPSRSTMDTTDAATMAVTTIPTATSRASERRRRGGGGATEGRAAGTGSPTHTPNGGG